MAVQVKNALVLQSNLRQLSVIGIRLLEAR